MAGEDRVRGLERFCSEITKLTPKKDSFIRRPEWGDLNFDIIENDIETVFWIVEEINKLPMHILTDNIIQNATTNLAHVKHIFDRIDGFKISKGDSSSSRDEISIELRRHVQNIISGIGIWLPFLALRAGEIENRTSKIRDVSDRTANLLRETESYATTQRQQIDESVQAARVAADAARAVAGEAGAAEFTDEFRKEADVRERRSKRWLWLTGFFSLCALGLSIAVMFGWGWFGDTPTNVWEAVYRLGGRVIAISVLFYAAVWSGRIALANMNLASVNRHRAVSLQTLKAFHKSVEDPAAKDAVVLEAARAVYENVPSGYIGRQATGPGAGSRTLEVIRGANRASRTTDEG